jgi:hypothetical protein
MSEKKKKRALSVEARAAAADLGDENGDSGERSPSPKRRTGSKVTNEQRVILGREALAELSKPVVTLNVHLASILELTETDQRSWISNLCFPEIEGIINASLNDNSASSDRILEFEDLGQIASLSRMFFMLFHHKSYDLWNKATVARIGLNSKGKPLPTKFTFIEKHFNAKRLKSLDPLNLSGMITYLNLFGTGFCEQCGMYPDMCAETHIMDDAIPIAAFRTETAAEKAERLGPNGDTNPLNEKKFLDIYKSNPQASLPDWLKNFFFMTRNLENRYLCVNCNKPVNQEICGFPVACVFDACQKKRGGKGHVIRHLANDLLRPDGTTIDVDYGNCTRCGVLQRAGDEEVEVSGCAECDGDVEGNCICEECKLCTLLPGKGAGKCKCIIEVCSKCRAENCVAPNCRRCVENGCGCEEDDESTIYSSSENSSDSSGSD